MRGGRRNLALLLIGAVLFAAIGGGCRRSEPVRVGFIGPLSGRGSSLGVAGRDGVLLAVEEANRAGGVGGRPLELLAEDDRQEPPTAAAVTRSLLERRVAALIGPMTSNVLPAMLPLVEQARTVLVSPTCSTEDLTGKDDYFLRLHAPIGRFAYALAHLVHDRMALHRIHVLIDRGNWGYTGSFLENFRKGLTVIGGEIPLVVEFTSAAQPSFAHLARQLMAQPADAVLILANAPDTAMIAQQLAKFGTHPQLVASEWSSTPELLANGGRAVEGMVIFHSFDEASHEPAYQRFRSDFFVRFGYQPNFAAAYGYESARYLLAGLRQGGAGAPLREALLAQESFAGLQGEIHFDRFGDPSRSFFPLRITGGRLEPVALP